MRSLIEVTGPGGVHGLQANRRPPFLIWMEGGDDFEVFAIMRAFLSGQFSLTLQDVPNTNDLAENKWHVRRRVRVTIFSRILFVAELSKEDGDAEADDWWETILLRELRLKFAVSEVEVFQESEV